MNIVKFQDIKSIHRNPFAFPYTNNEKTERESKETISFTTATKRIKYLGINLPKETKVLYIENYKTLMREIKCDTNSWRNMPCSWVGRVDVVRMSEESTCLTSDYTTKPQSSREYGTGTKTEI